MPIFSDTQLIFIISSHEEMVKCVAQIMSLEGNDDAIVHWLYKSCHIRGRKITLTSPYKSLRLHGCAGALSMRRRTFKFKFS
jgi:hypothetical protein